MAKDDNTDDDKDVTLASEDLDDKLAVAVRRYDKNPPRITFLRVKESDGEKYVVAVKAVPASLGKKLLAALAKFDKAGLLDV